MFPELIEKLTRHEDLTSDEAAAAMNEVMAGRAAAAQIAGLLVGLAMKGERPVELVGLARAMRAYAVPMTTRFDQVFDACRTAVIVAADIQHLVVRGACRGGVRRPRHSMGIGRCRACPAARTSSKRSACRSRPRPTMAICLLSFMVWLHHFFTMGAGADVNAIFGIASMIIAVPTGVKIYNWLFTMYGGRIRFATPMMWSIGFMVTFIIGGLTGVLLAVPPADFLLHNSLFLIAHFHNVIIGGVLFGAFAGYTYWFPKAFGFRLHEGLGKAAFWFWLVGFYVAFMPLYAVGFLGMTRRMQHYDVAGMASLADRGRCRRHPDPDRDRLPDRTARRSASAVAKELRDHTGDPWDGRSLEWATASPPPVFNFAVLPDVPGENAYWANEGARQATGRREAKPTTSRSRCRATRRQDLCARFSRL